MAKSKLTFSSENSHENLRGTWNELEYLLKSLKSLERNFISMERFEFESRVPSFLKGFKNLSVNYGSLHVCMPQEAHM